MKATRMAKLASAAVLLATACGRGEEARLKPPEAVRVAGPGTLAVAADSVFGKKLEVTTLQTEAVSIPIFSVTGSVAAQLRPGEQEREDRWQFSNADATAYADWRRTGGEIDFGERQLRRRELAKSRAKARRPRSKRFGSRRDGTVARDRASRRGEAGPGALEGEKDVFTAQSTLRLGHARRSRRSSAICRRRESNRVRPRRPRGPSSSRRMFRRRSSQVHEGQGCLARFYAFPTHTSTPTSEPQLAAHAIVARCGCCSN